MLTRRWPGRVEDAGLHYDRYRMPGMDGMELFAALTKAGVDAPVIIMTGHGEVPLAVAAMKAGVADFVEKPFNDDAIIGAISSAIRKHQDG